MHTVVLPAEDDFEAWRDHARALIHATVPPADVLWQVGATRDLFAAPPAKLHDAPPLAVPRAFVDLAQIVICHTDPERFARLYAMLWRLQADRSLIDQPTDPALHQLDRWAKAVRRGIHKMRAFVRFREIDGRFVAWFEPEHHIVRRNAGFFVRRFASMHWSILTPEISIHWDGAALTEGPGATRGDAPQDDPVEAMWKSYYASIFNPARVKIGAMLKEMPKKYWKNMPETALIPGLVATAQARERHMVADGQTMSARGWDALRAEAAACTRCPLWKPATQTVFGEGPTDAAIMLVGEQPGDQEDRAGRPFVGPAGQTLDRALAEAGIDRARLYITNAVKHFKFEPRGPRRIHAKPNAGEIDMCRWWLDQERAIVKPRVTIALGATAARGVFGKAMTVNASRGRAHALATGGDAFVTIHPSYLLRLNDPTVAEAEYARFVADLKVAAHHALSA